jgi:hypothetical protein
VLWLSLQEGWGLSMYEQDWLCTEYDGVEQLQTNISLADLWLEGMATGAERSGRTVQYCMPYPNDVLAAAALPAVTNARATGDYFHSDNQWAIGATAIMYWPIGVLPFKDGFYSSTLKQVGGQTEGPETDPDREALMATLSCAMVGPMDGIYLLNASRTMTTCRADGVVLKPDRPVGTSDWCFRHSPSAAASCYVYSTFSDVGGYGRLYYHFDNDARTFVPEMAGLQQSTSKYAIYNWYTRQVQPMQASNTLPAGYEGHAYAMVTPIVDGWAFIGETNKFVTASHLRFSSAIVSGTQLSVQLRGVASETVTVCAAALGSDGAWTLQCQQIAFASDGEQTCTFSRH